ncbi:hypothetical protein J6E39_02750 [bacterium]|nr:hypothetical protein [bacterium]
MSKKDLSLYGLLMFNLALLSVQAIPKLLPKSKPVTVTHNHTLGIKSIGKQLNDTVYLCPNDKLIYPNDTIYCEKLKPLNETLNEIYDAPWRKPLNDSTNLSNLKSGNMPWVKKPLSLLSTNIRPVLNAVKHI